MPKSPDAFRTISEVSTWLDTPAHVLRFWESKFTQIKPVKRAGGRRYYRPDDMALLGGIKSLLHDEGMTIKGVQKLLREKGVKHVAALGPSPEGAEDNVIDAVPPKAPEAEPAPEAPKAPALSVNLAPKPETAENVVPLTPTPPPEPEAEPETPAHNDTVEPAAATAAPPVLPEDPSDDAYADLSARMQPILHRASRGRVAKNAAAIAPLVARLEAVRARLGRD